MNDDKARQTNRPARRFQPLKATFGSAPTPLPGKLCLRMTARDFPHVVNRLAPHGYRPASMVENIDRLLIDDRPNRQGFPFAVVAELSELRAFYARMPQY